MVVVISVKLAIITKTLSHLLQGEAHCLLLIKNNADKAIRVGSMFSV